MWGIRFPADQRAAINAWAEANGVTRAEAIRRLIAKGLEVESAG